VNAAESAIQPELLIEHRGNTFSKKMFWVLILLGLFLPWMARISVEAFFKPEQIGRILRDFPRLLFAPGHNLFLLGIIGAIPVVIFALLTRWRYKACAGLEPAAFFPHKLGIIAAGLAVFGMSLFIHLVVWIDVFNPKGGSSTSVIAFVFLPFYALAAMPVGYLLGWLMGKLIRK
jgi:hypothetical protein